MRKYINRSKTGRIRVIDSDGAAHTILDERGAVYGELKVLELVSVNEFGIAVFSCSCSCGQRCEVTGSALRAAHNNTFSCGHVFAAQRGKNHPRYTHGHATQENLGTYFQWRYRKQCDARRQQAA
jgi:hypothetical protein